MTHPLILVLCTGNSCRSHLAEGILRDALGDGYRIASAGSKPAGYVHPLAIKAMAEIELDISGHHSKHLDEFLSDRNCHHGLRQCRPSLPDVARSGEQASLPF